MKQRILRYGLLACLLACFSACTRKDDPRPAPSGPAATVAAARAWFRQQPRPAVKGGLAARGDSSQSAAIAIDWSQALLVDNKLVAPFADTVHTFRRSGTYGYRFLVVQVAADSTYAGRLVELLTPDKPATPQQAAELALSGTGPLLAGQPPGPVADFTGSLLTYSPGYDYLNGRSYQDGDVQDLRMQLQPAGPAGPAGPDTCYDYFLVGYNNVGEQVVHDLLFSYCTGGIPGAGGGWGGGGGTSTGGGGSGSPGPATPPRTPCAALTRDG